MKRIGFSPIGFLRLAFGLPSSCRSVLVLLAPTAFLALFLLLRPPRRAPLLPAFSSDLFVFLFVLPIASPVCAAGGLRLRFGSFQEFASHLLSAPGFLLVFLLRVRRSWRIRGGGERRGEEGLERGERWTLSGTTSLFAPTSAATLVLPNFVRRFSPLSHSIPSSLMRVVYICSAMFAYI